MKMYVCHFKINKAQYIHPFVCMYYVYAFNRETVNKTEIYIFIPFIASYSFCHRRLSAYYCICKPLQYFLAYLKFIVLLNLIKAYFYAYNCFRSGIKKKLFKFCLADGFSVLNISLYTNVLH